MAVRAWGIRWRQFCLRRTNACSALEIVPQCAVLYCLFYFFTYCHFLSHIGQRVQAYEYLMWIFIRLYSLAISHWNVSLILCLESAPVLNDQQLYSQINESTILSHKEYDLQVTTNSQYDNIRRDYVKTVSYQTWMLSVCLSVCLCLSCSCCNFWKPWPRNFLLVCRYILRISSQVRISSGQGQGHRDKGHPGVTKYTRSRVARLRLKGNRVRYWWIRALNVILARKQGNAKRFCLAGWAIRISWSNVVCVCLDVNQGGTSRKHCSQRFIILQAQTY